MTYEKIRNAIIERQKLNEKRIAKPKDPRIIAANTDVKFMKDETAEEKAERYGLPDYDIEKLLLEHKVEDPKAKLKEHQIDKEVFWTMNEGELGKFGIEKFGPKRRLAQQMAQIKKDHEKMME